VSFRARLLAVFALTVVVAVGLVAWIISSRMRDAFVELDSQRTGALLQQFRREFARRAQEVTERVEGIARAEDTQRMASALSGSAPDYSAYVGVAGDLATAHQLDFLELIADDGTLISSAQWPARFGYNVAWVREPVDWGAQGTFLKREELADGAALGIMSARAVREGDKNLYVVGGTRLGQEFLASLMLPEGMRALLYQDVGPNQDAGAGIAVGASGARPGQDTGRPYLVDASGPLNEPDKLMPLIARAKQSPRELSGTIRWTTDPASAETFHVIPLTGRQHDVLGMFLVGALLREQVELERHIRGVGILVAGAGIVIGIVLSGWAAGRVTRPVKQLAAASRQVADGNWNVHVDARSTDELGQLAQAFNQMTEQLIQQRDRLMQAERVAAWRELARRLAHELKNPLFPLQITVENMLRARESDPHQFDEVFRESTSTLLAELANLRLIIGRFSDFAKMPPPELQTVSLNELVTGALRVFESQLRAPGKPPITPRLDLQEPLSPIQADPQLLHRAVQNLILNAVDAMPSGGMLTLRTRATTDGVRLEVTDTGKGLTKEECERLFTPYYTTKQHGTGLGLAIVQSVISDHGGKISVESQPEQGTTFLIDLPQEGRKQ